MPSASLGGGCWAHSWIYLVSHRYMLGVFYMSTRCLLSPSGRPMIPWSSGWPRLLPLMWPPPLLLLYLLRLPVPSTLAAFGGTKVNSMIGCQS